MTDKRPPCCTEGPQPPPILEKQNNPCYALNREDDIPPDIVALMLFSEEKGMTMESSPFTTFSKLFPRKSKMRMTAVAGKEKAYALPLFDDGCIQDEDFLNELDDAAALDTDFVKHIAVPKIGGHGKFTATDIDAILGTQKGKSANVLPAFDKDDFKATMMYRGNLTSLRGTEAPPWFPGYYLRTDLNFKNCYEQQPYNALEKVWRRMSPAEPDPPSGPYLL